MDKEIKTIIKYFGLDKKPIGGKHTKTEKVKEVAILKLKEANKEVKERYKDLQVRITTSYEGNNFKKAEFYILDSNEKEVEISSDKAFLVLLKRQLVLNTYKNIKVLEDLRQNRVNYGLPITGSTKKELDAEIERDKATFYMSSLTYLTLLLKDDKYLLEFWKNKKQLKYKQSLLITNNILWGGGSGLKIEDDKGLDTWDSLDQVLESFGNNLGYRVFSAVVYFADRQKAFENKNGSIVFKITDLMKQSGIDPKDNKARQKVKEVIYNLHEQGIKIHKKEKGGKYARYSTRQFWSVAEVSGGKKYQTDFGLTLDPMLFKIAENEGFLLFNKNINNTLNKLYGSGLRSRHWKLLNYLAINTHLKTRTQNPYTISIEKLAKQVGIKEVLNSKNRHRGISTITKDLKKLKDNKMFIKDFDIEGRNITIELIEANGYKNRFRGVKKLT